MSVSVLDIFKIGVGPSSSHTVGPMRAGKMFVDELKSRGLIDSVTRVAVHVYGSLAATGRGHRTDVAIILGIAGNEPETVDIDGIDAFVANVRESGTLPLGAEGRAVSFPFAESIVYHDENLPLHENGMILRAYAGAGEIFSQTYYSVGGGFVVTADEFSPSASSPLDSDVTVPYPFSTADELLRHCKENAMSLSGLALQNELAHHSQTEIDDYFEKIWRVMQQCVARGLSTEGLLPGALKLPRRAAALQRQLRSTDSTSSDPMRILDYVSMYALAASEENAAGGRVVTAPTNGACGIVPAVLMYYGEFIRPVAADERRLYFLSTGTIGILYKTNASISGAEVGCQGEVGVACSMAAAGLAELMGGSAGQVCAAAEIAMEHNLGLTCDPVGGLVQVPCIERNAVGAVMAISAARMALRRTSDPRISLDTVIETMRETGRDMNAKYRETARGGLAKTVRCE